MAERLEKNDRGVQVITVFCEASQCDLVDCFLGMSCAGRVVGTKRSFTLQALWTRAKWSLEPAYANAKSTVTTTQSTRCSQHKLAT